MEEKGSSAAAKDERDPVLPKPDNGIVDIAVAAIGLILRDIRYATPSNAPPCKPITFKQK